MTETKKREFRGPTVSRLPSGFRQRVIDEARTPDGLARADLTRWTGQDCRWSEHLDEIAKSVGHRLEMKQLYSSNRI